MAESLEITILCTKLMLALTGLMATFVLLCAMAYLLALLLKSAMQTLVQEMLEIIPATWEGTVRMFGKLKKIIDKFKEKKRKRKKNERRKTM